jgi:hypothetical protein
MNIIDKIDRLCAKLRAKLNWNQNDNAIGYIHARCNNAYLWWYPRYTLYQTINEFGGCAVVGMSDASPKELFDYLTLLLNNETEFEKFKNNLRIPIKKVA